jgi:hypothetical protein
MDKENYSKALVALTSADYYLEMASDDEFRDMLKTFIEDMTVFIKNAPDD